MSQRLLSLGLIIGSTAAANSYAAVCEYKLASQWNNGFLANITITNDTDTTIDGWQVNWELANGESINNGWSASFSNSNPYSASDLGWNSVIRPGGSIEFGFVGKKQPPQIT